MRHVEHEWVSSHISSCTITFVEKPHPADEFVMSHMNESSHMSHMNESCLVWVMSPMNLSCLIWIRHVSYEWVISRSVTWRVNESLSHISGGKNIWRDQRSHILPMNASCQIWMIYAKYCHVTCEWVMSHISGGKITFIEKPKIPHFADRAPDENIKTLWWAAVVQVCVCVCNDSFICDVSQSHVT